MDSKIKVAVRCRPFQADEPLKYGPQKITPTSITIGNKEYNFEHVLNDSSTQVDVYNVCVKTLVEGWFEGYNGTVFAYGQTGSGKTHSIMGGLHAQPSEEEIGMIPRAIQQIFQTLHSPAMSNRMATIRVSMIELYNDECNDLLHPEIPSRDIMIREDKHGRIFFTGAREEIITSMRQGLQYLEIGNINRTTAETLMNQTSSRSHAIFTISLEMLEYAQDEGGSSSTLTTERKHRLGDEHGEEEDQPTNADGESMIVTPSATITTNNNNNHNSNNVIIHAKLHLVDLAGSERAKKTGASGLRFKESVGINQGLLSLGKVIRALTAHENSNAAATAAATTINGLPPSSIHIPYRESKLTRFLQDSLGGNSRTILLACISPCEASLHETINTLQYAQRAKMIHNRVMANVSTAPSVTTTTNSVAAVASMAQELQAELESSLVVSLKAEIQRMQQEMMMMVMAGNNTLIDDSLNPNYLATQQYQQHQQQQQRLIKDSESRYQQQLIIFRQIRSVLQKVLVVHNNNKYSNDDPTSVAAVTFDELQKVCSKVLTIVSEALLSAAAAAAASAPAVRGGVVTADPLDNSLRRSLRESLQDLKRVALAADQGTGRGQGSKDTDNDKDGVIEQLEEEIQSLTEELSDCKEDLKKDELIFLEKQKEMKRYKKQIKELETENKVLKEQQMILQQQMSKLVKIPKLFIQQPSSGKEKAEDKEEDEDILTQEDLDLSIAVTLTEPDISQLMEDLESLWKEKEELITMNKTMEEKMMVLVEQVAQQQQKKVARVQDALTKKVQMKELILKEKNIENDNLKEKISRLEKDIYTVENDRRGMKDEYLIIQSRYQELQERYSRQQQEIEELERRNAATAVAKNKEQWFDGEEDEEEDDVEDIADAKDAKQHQRHSSSQQQKSSSSSASSMSNNSPQKFIASVEHLTTMNHDLQLKLRSLQLEKESQETKHRYEVEDLQKKLNKKMKEVEEEKDELTQRLVSLQEEQKKEIINQQEAHTKAIQEQQQKYHQQLEVLQKEVQQQQQKQQQEQSKLNKKKITSNKQPPSSSLLLRASHTEQLNTWLEESIAQIVEEGMIQVEVVRLTKALQILMTDKEGYQKELEQLRANKAAAAASAAVAATAMTSKQQQQQQQQQSFHQKIQGIDEKMKSLKLKISNLKRKMLQYQQQPLNDQQGQQQQIETIRHEIEDYEYSIQSYEEHKIELLERYYQPPTATAVSNNVSLTAITAEEQDLMEDIEAIDTEISALENRLLVERDHLHAIQEMNSKKFGISYHATNSSARPASGTTTVSTAAMTTTTGAFQLDNLVRNMMVDVKQFHRHLLVADGNKATSADHKADDGDDDDDDDDLPADPILALTFKMYIKARIKAGAQETTWREARSQYENKCSEYDNLVKAMQRMRNDAIKKQDIVKREWEEKVSFLVNQIRHLETSRPQPQHQQQQQLLQLQSATMPLPQPPPQAIQHQHTALPPSSYLTPRGDSYDHQHQSSSSRPNSGLVRLSSKKSLSDLALQQEGNKEEAQMNQEVLKRWVSEKERREQLEKRNSEMAKELRQLRKLQQQQVQQVAAAESK